MVRNRCFSEPRAPNTDTPGHLHMTQHFLRNRYQTAVYPPPTACCGALSLANAPLIVMSSIGEKRERERDDDDDDDDNQGGL